jgi:hypothetical protein
MPSKERLIRNDIPKFSFVENGVEINNESIFRPRLGEAEGGGGCSIVTVNTTISGGELRYFPNILSLSSPGQSIFDFSTIQSITGLPSASFVGDGVARYGDKIWIGIIYQGGGSFTGASQLYNAILELDFDESIPSASFNRVIFVSQYNPVFAARCGINNTTVSFSIGNVANGISLFDVSGTNAVETNLFSSSLTNSGSPANVADAVYLPSTDTWVLIEIGSSLGITHRDSSGILVGNFTSGLTGHSLFCNNGEIYIGSGNVAILRKLDFTNYTIGPNIPISEIMGDAATNPECCDSAGPAPPCYQVGDIGPGGGIIFFHNSTNDEYYEVGMNDLSSITEPTFHSNYSGVPCSEHEGGAEWGLMNAGSGSGFPLSFGSGEVNTDVIYNLGVSTYHSNLAINPGGDAACPNSPCHPTNDTRTIAADLCKQYNGGGLNDWFLPSFGELLVAMWNVGATQTPSNNLAAFTTIPPGQVNIVSLHPSYYWTSSIVGGTVTAVAMSSTVFNSTPTNTLRCATWLVRPVRKFICTLAPPRPLTPCIGCTCIEYNYRDYAWASLPTGTPGGVVGHLGQGSNFMPGTNTLWPGGYSNWMNNGDSIIGNEECFISMGATDVMGNEWNLVDWEDDSIGYTISVWDRWYNFLGKWHYSTHNVGSSLNFESYHNLTTPHPLFPHRIRLAISGVTHLEGPNPIVNYNIGPSGQQLGSTTKAFFKIEAACNTNLGVAFENGCNHLFGQHDAPAACVHGTVVGYPQITCTQTFGTYTILYIIYSSWGACFSSGCGSSSLISGSQAKLANPLSNIITSMNDDEELGIPIVESVENKRLNELRNRNTQAYKRISNETVLSTHSDLGIQEGLLKLPLSGKTPGLALIEYNVPENKGSNPNLSFHAFLAVFPPGCFGCPPVPPAPNIPLYSGPYAFFYTPYGPMNPSVSSSNDVYNDFGSPSINTAFLMDGTDGNYYCMQYTGITSVSAPAGTFSNQPITPYIIASFSTLRLCMNEMMNTSWDCVQIGDHPKFGFKCIEVQGTNGQYATKADCLQSGCEGIADPGIPTSQIPPGGFTPLTGGTSETSETSGGEEGGAESRESEEGGSYD